MARVAAGTALSPVVVDTNPRPGVTAARHGAQLTGWHSSKPKDENETKRTQRARGLPALVVVIVVAHLPLLASLAGPQALHWPVHDTRPETRHDNLCA